MHLFLWVTVAIVLLITGLAIWFCRMSLKLHFKGQDIKAWLNAYNSIGGHPSNYEDRKKLLGLPDIPPGWDHLQEVQGARSYVDLARKDEARRLGHQEHVRVQNAGYAASVNALKQVDSLAEHYDELLALFGKQGAGNDRQWVRDQLVRLADERCAQLLEAARAGDRDSFLQLRSFTTGSQYGDGYHHDTGKAYIPSGDYDELMVKYLRNPHWGDFRRGKSDFASGEIRLLAAAALRNRSLLQAKVVLALCNAPCWPSRGYTTAKEFPFRQEVGPVLLAEVAKLVDRLHKELELIFSNTTPTTK